jgi:hypothetical protein
MVLNDNNYWFYEVKLSEEVISSTYLDHLGKFSPYTNVWLHQLGGSPTGR